MAPSFLLVRIQVGRDNAVLLQLWRQPHGEADAVLQANTATRAVLALERQGSRVCFDTTEEAAPIALEDQGRVLALRLGEWAGALDKIGETWRGSVIIYGAGSAVGTSWGDTALRVRFVDATACDLLP